MRLTPYERQELVSMPKIYAYPVRHPEVLPAWNDLVARVAWPIRPTKRLIGKLLKPVYKESPQ